MKKICIYIFIGSYCMGTPALVWSQKADTLATVTLLSKKPFDISSSTVPVQQLDKNTLNNLNSNSVSDALKYFSGVVIKDYGGIGGLKTVSVRSLGANHTGVCYDGIILGDAQGGQIDLGRFSLDNLESIRLYNNQPSDVLMPARTYASASVIALASTSFLNRNVHPRSEFSIKVKAGSFGFSDPAVHYQLHYKKIITGISAGYQSARGDYPYVDYETGNSSVRRNNSDIKSWRLEYDATYSSNDSNQVKLKVYCYNSKRGLPGSVILYNNFSGARLNNGSFFSQFSWQKSVTAKSRILFSSKYSADHKYYLDPSFQNAAGKLENEFYQKEFYFSGVFSYRFFPNLTGSYSSDYFKSTLRRTDPFSGTFANPERDNFLNNIALQWKQKRFELDGNLLHTYISGKVEQGPVASNLHEFTPAFSVSLQPLKDLPVRFRTSYKKIFRAPTFDDLYYTNIGNASLRPEFASLYNMGITADVRPEKCVKELILTADAYYNYVKDKILAVPRQNLFQWTILNIGTVKTKGMDIAMHINFVQWRGMNLATNISYSYQNALDYSDPSSGLYKSQLPYTPVHSGSINFSVNCKKISLAYNILSSSYRYRLGEPGPENVVQGWATHDVSFSYSLSTRQFREYRFIAEANNIFNKQYEIIKYYPMPRFNYRLGITATL